MSSKPQGDRNVNEKPTLRGLLNGTLQHASGLAATGLHIGAAFSSYLSAATSLIVARFVESCKLEMAAWSFYFVVLREQTC